MDLTSCQGDDEFLKRGRWHDFDEYESLKNLDHCTKDIHLDTHTLTSCVDGLPAWYFAYNHIACDLDPGRVSIYLATVSADLYV
jgi:hypothetical protein